MGRREVQQPPALPPGRDPQLGQIFRNMRLAMKVTREGLARRLATTPLIIDSFEAGTIGALPHGKETTRIVRGYCELLRLDPEPILWRIQTQLQALASHRAAAPARAPKVLAGGPRRRAHDVHRAEPARDRPRHRGRMLFALSAPIALFAALAYAVHTTPRPFYRTLAVLPVPIAKPARVGLDYLMLLTASSRDGLKWIEISDPQLRKADKLQVSKP
jgi:hypothetical protein